MSANCERRASSVERRDGSGRCVAPRPAPLDAHPASRRGPHRPLALLSLAISVSGCAWFTDFKRQPKVDPWESEADTVTTRGNPQMSVPVTGTFVAGFQVSYQPLPATVDSMSGIANPTAVSDSSLANGHKYYQINCAVCHGDRGMGDGPATKYGMPGIGIGVGSNAANRYSDGYVYGMIRNGRGLMPSYDRIEEMDRWDVVNYLRALQGKAGRDVAVGPVGYPGQTGAALPGYSRMAPTRPSPFLRPSLNTGAVTGVPSGPMTTDVGTPTTPGGAADSLGRTQPGHSGPGSAHQPAPPGAARSTDSATAGTTRPPGGTTP